MNVWRFGNFYDVSGGFVHTFKFFQRYAGSIKPQGSKGLSEARRGYMHTYAQFIFSL